MRSELAKLFARRLQEEMERNDHLSGNALAQLAGVGQRTVARILLPDGHKDQQTPSLDIVDALANALGVPAWFLLVEANSVEQRVIKPPMAAQTRGVYKLPRPYPAIFPPHERGRKSRAARKK